MRRMHQLTASTLLTTLALLVPACGDNGASDGSEADAGGDNGDENGEENTDGGSDDGDNDTGGGGPGPSGPCPLEGMFDECTIDGESGTTWCDEIDGELIWGACQTDAPCEFYDPQPGCQDCELIDGQLVLTGSATCECEAPAVEGACAQTECSNTWNFSCGECQSFVGGGNCFTYSEGCESPWLDCDMDDPCNRVWAQGFPGELEPLEDTQAAICTLEALRDRTPGRYRILWGEMGDGGWINEHVYIGAGGDVVSEWYFNCPGCQGFGAIGRSGTLTLQPEAWFDECLADPTEQNLIDCLVGLADHPDQLPPEGYLPPFSTGSCGSLEAVCP